MDRYSTGMTFILNTLTNPSSYVTMTRRTDAFHVVEVRECNTKAEEDFFGGVLEEYNYQMTHSFRSSRKPTTNLTDDARRTPDHVKEARGSDQFVKPYGFTY